MKIDQEIKDKIEQYAVIIVTALQENSSVLINIQIHHHILHICIAKAT